MRTRWLGAALVAWCLMGSVAHAQWGLNGQEADPRLLAESDNPPDSRPGIQLDTEYLAWWFKDPHLANPVAAGGATGKPVLIGPDSLNYPDPFSGFRASARFWADTTSTGSFEVVGMVVGSRTNTVSAVTSTTTPTIFSLQSNPATGAPVVVPIATLGALPGGMLVSGRSLLWGGEANFIGTPYDWLDIIAGFRYLDLDESVDVRINRTGPVAAFPPIDHYGTRNQFFGGQLGARASYTYGSWSASAQAKIAAGDNEESVHIHNDLAGGGLYVFPSNTGVVTRSKFSIVPECQARVGYLLAGNVQLYAGYNWLYFQQVARPGDQIDTRRGVANGITYPQVPFGQTSFWAQGFEFGFELRY